MNTILIIEDETDIRDYLIQYLQQEGFVVEGAGTGSLGLNRLEKLHPEVVILDLGLPDITGETVLKEIRENFPHTATIILTAKSTLNDVVTTLNLGADDYLTKPFAEEELLARIRARLRDNHIQDEKLTLADLTVNLSTRDVTRQNLTIKLTKTEFDLLVYLLKNPGRVLTKDMILNHVWGYQTDVESRVVDVYISYLRKKIDHPFSHPLIHNHRGVGYSLSTNQAL